MAGDPSLPSWAKGKPRAGSSSGPKDPSLPSWAHSGSTTHAAARPQKKTHHHRGLLGSIGHTIAQTGEDLAGAAEHLPGGLYQLAHSAGHDEWKLLGSKRAKGGFQLPGIAKQTAKATAQDLRHPLRHPGNTLLDVAALASLGGGTAARISEVGRAARAGEGLAEVAKAAVRKPPVRLRQFKVGEEDANLHASKNPIVRAGQAAHDKVVRKALEEKPDSKLARYGNWRLGGSLAETRRYQVAMQKVRAEEIRRSGAKLMQHEKDALRLTAEQTTPEEAIATAKREIAAGNVGDNKRWIKRLQTVRASGLVKMDGGHVVIDAGKHPRLAALDEKIAKGSAERDAILAAHGEMTPEGLKRRVDEPNAVHAGGKYEKPTPGKLGKPSANLLLKRSRVVRLQSVYDRLLAKTAKQAKALPAETTQLRPRTRAEGEARLAQLEKQHEQLLADATKSLKGGVPFDAGETATRNQARARYDRQQQGITRSGKASGASGSKEQIRPKTLAQDLRDEAQTQLDALAAKHKAEPWAKAYLAQQDEIAQLRAAVHEGHPVFGSGKAVTYGEAKKPTQAASLSADSHNPAAIRIGYALSVAKDELASHEAAAARRVRPTGLSGTEPIRPGRSFVSYAQTELKGGAAPFTASPGAVVGGVKNIVAKNKAFTGAGLRAGHVPEDVPGIVSRGMLRAYKRANSEEFRAQLARMGSDTKRSQKDVLVSTQEIKNARVGELDRALLGQRDFTLEEQAAHATGFRDWLEQAVPGLRDKFASERTHPLGSPSPEGYRWVPKQLLGELGRMPVAHDPGWTIRRLDDLNASVTAATVYLKPGHVVTRAGTNAFANIVQGSATPVGIAESVRLWKALSDEDKARGLAAAGQQGFLALPAEETSGAGRFAARGSKFWARHFDAPFRFNSIAYEARKAGINTPARFRKFLDDLEKPDGLNAAERAKIDWVARRANREQIAYDRLSAFEQQRMTRYFWFYPWTAASIRFAGNTLLEHPLKSYGFDQAGQIGEQAQSKQLGALPQYLQGLIRIGGSKANPTVMDLSSVTPFSTPAEVVNTLLQTPGHRSPGEFLNPGAGALGRAVFELNQYGESGHPNSPRSLLAAIAAPTLPAGFVRDVHGGSRTFPVHNIRQSILHLLTKPAGPRKLDPPAARRSAYLERHPRR